MRKPREAPTFGSLLKLVTDGGGKSLPELLQRSFGALFDGRYLHWDDLQYRTPPEGLTREEWWLLAKFNRTLGRRLVPLLDKTGGPFTFLVADPIPERLHEIDLRCGGHIQMPEQVTNPDTRDQYYVNSLIEEAITSSQLEGATTTRRVAKDMLRSGRAPRDRSERMILNNYLTMRRIGALRGKPLTQELIFEIHRLITDGTLDDPTAAGRFRHADEEIAVFDESGEVFHEPPPAAELEERITRLCQFANRTEGPFVHPVLRSIILHFMIGYDHPFVDGNGRTARALFYWSMLRHGYWLAEFISISHIVLKAPTQYSKSYLHTETDEGDLTYFILYNLKVVVRALESLHEYIARKAAEMRSFEAEMKGIELLNHRQQAVLRHAVRHPGKRYTIEEHRRSHDISYETSRSDLLDLAKRDLMEAKRDGKKWVFIPQPQLTERLAAIGAGRSGTLT